MKKQLLLLMLTIPLFCMAQPGLTRQYEYDASGNRIVRKTLQLNLAPPAPQNPIESDLFETENVAIEYFVEKIAQVEIKIYPNPTSEKVTLEISNMEKLQTGNFTLYSLTGQLLQNQPVHSASSTISLADLPKGVYILKVRINERMEEWKVIKN